MRFHDLRHTFATMALEHGMDVKTLSATIGHVSSATTFDIYSHITDTMQRQTAVHIDRKIGKTDAQMPVEEQTPEATAKPPVNAPCAPTEPHPEPIPRKIRKSVRNQTRRDDRPKKSGDRTRKSKTKRGRQLRRPQKLVCSKQRKIFL